MSKRINWVDTLKGIGMILIFTGHNLSSSNLLYGFISTFHVPLFFFCAGFFCKKEGKFINYFKTKFKHIMIPYFIFSICALLFFTLKDNFTCDQIIYNIQTIASGVRNSLICPALWFLPCIFCMYILNCFLLKITKNKLKIVLIIAILIKIMILILISSNKISIPSMFWNFDSCLYYYVWMALGMNLYDIIIKNTQKKTDVIKKSLKIICNCLIVVLMLIVYFKKIDFLSQYLNIQNYVFQNIIMDGISFIFICFCISISIAIQKIEILNIIGRESLYLCCTETIAKVIIGEIVSLVGLSVVVNNSLCAIIYSLILICTLCYIKKHLDKNRKV